MHSEKERGVHARRRRNSFLMRVNFVLAAAGFAFLAEAVLYPDGRGSPIVALLFGVPLLITQLVCGLVFAISCLTRERLTGGERLRVLVPAIGGPLATVSACVFWWQTGSMC